MTAIATIHKRVALSSPHPMNSLKSGEITYTCTTVVFNIVYEVGDEVRQVNLYSHLAPLMQNFSKTFVHDCTGKNRLVFSTLVPYLNC